MTPKPHELIGHVKSAINHIKFINEALASATANELYAIQEFRNEASGGEPINFHVLALQIQTERLAKQVEREW